MVVFILVVLWAAVLGPLVVRRLRDGEPLGSVDSFYHELHLLERAAPKTVAPANRLETAFTGGVGPGSSGYPSVSSMPGRPSLVLLRPAGSPDGGMADGGVADDPGRATAAPGPERYRRLAVVPENGTNGGYGPGVRAPSSLAARDHAYQVRRCQRRRRDILLGLLATAVVTGPLGTLHSYRALWVFTVLSVVLLVAYVYLLVRAQQVAMARRVTRTAAPRRRRAPERDVPRAAERDHRRVATGVTARRAASSYPGTRRHRRDDPQEEWQEDPEEWQEDPSYLRRLAAMGQPGGWGPEEDVGRAARAGYPGAWDDLDAAPVYAPVSGRLAVGG